MHQNEEILLNQVKKFVEKSFQERLDRDFYFHNLQHTFLVAEGVNLIGEETGLSSHQRFILRISAYLHDIGYIEKYIGHEQESATIAAHFLELNGMQDSDIELVTGCILSTKFPQWPGNILEEVMCDGDFFHFSQRDYPDYAARLRLEWEHKLNKTYSDTDWNKLNLAFLKSHDYFTAYGKDTLQKNKDKNIQKLEKGIGSSSYP